MAQIRCKDNDSSAVTAKKAGKISRCQLKHVFLHVNHKNLTMTMIKQYLGLFESVSENIIQPHVWANGQRGAMLLNYWPGEEREVYYSYFEMPEGQDEERKEYIAKYWEKNIKVGYVVACGIVAAWIRGRPHVLTEELFDKYAQKHKHYFFLKNRSNPDSTPEKLESDGYLDCIEAERSNIHISHDVFEYVSEEEQKLLRALITNYLLYLYKKADRMDIYQEVELRVLQHLSKGADELMPEGMKEWEFNAVCDRLEKEGCVRVAWIEGHQPEAVMLLDAGRMRLKELEAEVMGTDSEFEQMRRENMALRSQMQPQYALADDEIVKELASCFYGMEEVARAFLNQIKNVGDKEKTAIARQYLDQKKLSEKSAKRPLWRILTKYKLYAKTEDNWNKGIRKK